MREWRAPLSVHEGSLGRDGGLQRGRHEAPSLPLASQVTNSLHLIYLFKSFLEFFKSSLVPTNLSLFKRLYYQDI